LYWDVVLLELAELVSPKFSPALGDVDPKTAMTADARGSLDGKADDDRVAARRCQVDVLARHLRRPVVVEGQQIDVVGDHCFGHHSFDGGDSSELRELILAVELSKKLVDMVARVDKLGFGAWRCRYHSIQLMLSIGSPCVPPSRLTN